ncbi:inx-10 [Pristionchus pacificus]|uniref:Innexin n=1 Tax=Pristionchus pacificus TaxID=54126 RepID=A0A2A6CQS8_PRIPA|nr:inx-10 [Pristionchus pacificus]|eukprot:PDM80574.1 inx-10 [Pristionchus pacificus]
MVLAATLSMLRYIGGSEDRDFVDRLHSYFTCNILIALSIMVSFKQFGGKPVECLVPDMFSSAWEQYAENYCWAQDTYFVPEGKAVAGMDDREKRVRRISYYQWVPFFLLMEAACFRLPSLLWKYLSGHSGIKITEIVKLSSDPNNIKPEIKKANIKSITMHLQGALRFHKRLQKKQIKPHKFFWMCNLPYSAFFVTSMYITTKLFYFINVVLQLLLMNKFLETDRYSWYGFGAIVDLIAGSSWKTSGVFPRVSLCDFDVRVMGNVQEHTIQCVLVINIFNEKIFIFLWFWFAGLLLFTLGSLLYWFFVSVIPHPARRFISRHLEMSEMPFNADNKETEKEVDKFIDSFLRSDGVFVLRMITMQSGVIFGTDLTVSLWKSYYGEHIKRSNSFTELRPPTKKIEELWIEGDGFNKNGGPGDKSRQGSVELNLPAWLVNKENELRMRGARGGEAFPSTSAGRSPPVPPRVPSQRDGTAGERIRLIPPPAPPPDFMRHVALIKGTGDINDPNDISIIRSVSNSPAKRSSKPSFH